MVRLSTFLFLVLGIASLGGTGWFLWHATADRRAWNELRSYSGKDLSREPDRIQILAGRLVSRPAPDVAVRWILTLDSPGGRERILLCQPLRGEGAWLTLIDEHRHCLFSDIVRTQADGSRGEDIRSLRADSRPDLAPCMFAMEIDTQHASDIAVQYYAVLDDRPTLVRLEALSGESLPNTYRWGTPVGTPPPIRTSDEWEARLSSAAPAEILEVLLWLGGRHGDSEPPDQIARFQGTARQPGVLRRLRELARHPHPWIAHAAEQARLQLEK